jgi:hypothetical protein
MTDNTVDLDAKRKAKTAKGPRCEICGEPVHDYPGQCDRISAITYESPDGISVTYHLYPLEPVAGD